MLVSSFSFSFGISSLSADEGPELIGNVLVNGDEQFDSDSVANTGTNQHRWMSYPESRMVINPGNRPALGANLGLKVGIFVNGVRNLTSNTNATLMSVQMGPIGGTAANSTSRTTGWYPYKVTSNGVYANSTVSVTDYFANKDVFVRMMDVNGAAGQEMTLATGSSAISGLTWALQPDGSVLGTNTNYYLAFKLLLLNADGTIASTITPTVSGATYNVKIPFTGNSGKVAMILTTAPRTDSTAVALGRLGVVEQQGNFITLLANSKTFWDGKLGKVPAPTVWGIQAGMDPKGVTPAAHRNIFYSAWTFVIGNIIEPTPETGYNYYQVGLGKASMWTGGAAATPNSCAWESMFEIEELALVEPEIAWSAAEGFIKLINDDGTLPGECLPSQKAHMVWTCYANLADDAKLAELYPKLRAYLLWRGDNPRWIWGSHNYADEKDISFVTQWYSDVNYVIKMCEILGYTADIAMWEARKDQMAEDARVWFFTPAAGAPEGKIYNSCFPTRTGNQYHYYGDRTEDVDNYILSGLFVSDYPADMDEKLVNHYKKMHDNTKDLVGLDFFKYGDGCHIAYGLLEKSRVYPELKQMYYEFINANIRNVIRVGEFCEESRPDRLTIQGTNPTSFGANTMIDFTYMNNNVRIDSGKLVDYTIIEPDVGSVISTGDWNFDSDDIGTDDTNQTRWLSFPASRMQINPGIRPALGNNLALKVGLFINGVRNITSSANASLMNVQMGPVGGTAANSTSRTTEWFPYKLTARAVYANSTVNMTEYFVNKDIFVRMLDVSASANQEITLTSGSTAISNCTFAIQPDGTVLGTNTNTSSGNYFLAFKILVLNSDGTVKSTVTPSLNSGNNTYTAKIPVTDGTAKVAFVLTAAARAITASGDVLTRLGNETPVNFVSALANTKAYWDGKLGKVPAPTVWGIQAGMDPKGVTPESHRRMFYTAWTFVYQNIIEPTLETNYPYYQVGLGKASMWNGGHSSTPNSCAWESMFEIEELALVEPEIAWSAAEGFIKLINDDGTLAGECLPSQKAHMVWTCYTNLPDNARLAELYPKLKAYLLWRGNNPRWIWSSHNYAGEKDISFVTQWYSDVNYVIKMCEILGYTDDIAMWEARKAQMTEDSRLWFFTPQAGDPEGKIYNTYFTNTGLHYNSARPTDVDNYILSALFISDFPDDMVKKLVDHYATIHDSAKDLVGLDFFKYGDGCHIVYGLINKSSPYPYLEDMYKEFINANIRTVVKVGEFCEESRPDNYATQGTCPTSFGSSTMIDFTYINNGVRIDSGHLAAIEIPEDPNADPIRVNSVKFKMDDEYITAVELGEISLEVTIKAYRDVTIGFNPFIAVYNKTSGKLIEVAGISDYKAYELKKGDVVVLETSKVTIPEALYKRDVIVKGFVWDGDMIPLNAPTQLSDWSPKNLALNKSVAASSEQNSNGQWYYAIYAVDGNASTRWAPATVNNQWLRVDLGQVTEISRVFISWESAYARSFRIEVSTTGTADADFTTVYSTTTGPGGKQTITFAPVNARYVRLYNVNSSNSSWGASVYEFEIYSE